MLREIRPAPLNLAPFPSNSDSFPPISAVLSCALHSSHALRTAGSQILSAGLLSAKEALKSAKDIVEQTIVIAKDHLTLSIHRALKTAKATPGGLIAFHDLPDPWKINPHIKQGYRFCEKQTDCVASIFHLNNESINIWSHAVGFICIIFIAFYVYPNTDIPTTNLDNLFIGIFLLAAAKCMLFSCTYHTMNSIADHELNKMFTCADYTGISLLIGTSLMTTEHFAFNCHPTSWWIYISITGTLALGGVAVPWHPWFRGNNKAGLRAIFYTSLVASGVFPPLIHLTYLYGWSWTAGFYAPIAKSLLIYFTGCIIYVAKVPERWYPGIFDYGGGSHNIWHCAVLLGILMHYNATIAMFNTSLEIATPECRPGVFL